MAKIERAINNISDAVIEEALDIDNAEKLKKAMRAEKKKKMRITVRITVKRLSVLAACICLCFCIFTVYKQVTAKPDDRVEIASPITEVTSVAEMEKYLGFTVPVPSGKTAENFVLYSDGRYAYMGEISFEDGSRIRAEKGNGDISGVFGGTLKGTQSIENITVYFYTMEDLRYAIWQTNGMSYCYYASETETNYSFIIAELISATH